MKRPAWSTLLLAAFALSTLVLAAPSAATAAAPGSEAGSAMRLVIDRACSAAVQATSGDDAAAAPAASSSCLASAIGRKVLAGDVVEYSLQVQVGPGEHDMIGLHRVVREVAPFVPVHAGRALMMAHGDAWGFDAAFLTGLVSPVPAALPVFLAQNGIDVWGIDFRWTLVPATTTSFTFMQTWGIATDAGDLGVALGVARLTRRLTGDGNAKLDLLGWSRGGETAYVYVNAETQVPATLRQVGGLIPVDIFVRTDSADVRQAACARQAAEQALFTAGTFDSNSGTLFATLGNLAIAAPTAASPILAGLTNQQAALLAGSATYSLLPPGQSFTPFYHFVAGTFDAQGLPTGFTYTPQLTWFTELAGAAPFEPEKVLADGDSYVCGQASLPTGDHLAEITLPVLFIGAGGGVGQYGVYTTTLLGSSDITIHIVQLQPTSARALDFGHVDIYDAANAPSQVWQTILTWMQAH